MFEIKRCFRQGDRDGEIEKVHCKFKARDEKISEKSKQKNNIFLFFIYLFRLE